MFVCWVWQICAQANAPRFLLLEVRNLLNAHLTLLRYYLTILLFNDSMTWRFYYQWTSHFSVLSVYLAPTVQILGYIKHLVVTIWKRKCLKTLEARECEDEMLDVVDQSGPCLWHLMQSNANCKVPSRACCQFTRRPSHDWPEESANLQGLLG